MPVLEYMIGDWARHVSHELNQMSAAFPDIEGFYGPSGWFYEGTVQAVAYTLLWRWTEVNAWDDYVLLMEQPYWLNNRSYASDIMSLNRRGEMIYVEIKADFNIASVENDLYKLHEARALEGIVAGIALYCVHSDQAARWAAHLQTLEYNQVRALPIIKY